MALAYVFGNACAPKCSRFVASHFKEIWLSPWLHRLTASLTCKQAHATHMSGTFCCGGEARPSFTAPLEPSEEQSAGLRVCSQVVWTSAALAGFVE